MIMSEATYQKPEAVSYGKALSTGREKLGLTIKDVASRLNLQPEIIAALETEDSNTLPAPIYVRGYIRSYARILKLDEENLISLYNTNAGKAPELLPEVKHTQIRSSDKPVKIATYMVSFGLVLLLFAWWQSHFIVNDNPNQESKDNVKVYNTEHGGALNYDYEIVIHPDTPFINQINYDENGLTEQESAAPDDVQTDNMDLAGNGGDDSDSVNLVVEKDSWIEVSDADDKKIYLGIAKTGETINLGGKAPFTVILGYAPGVKVSFNGKPFNTEPFTSAGVARFVLTR